MKAKGCIVGVVVQPTPICCDTAQRLPTCRVYHPDQAPRLLLPDYPQGRRCDCVYRPVMTNEHADEG
jgi:hypothetical protein